MARGGEWDELLDLLATALLETRARVTADERNLLRDAFSGWGMAADGLDHLDVDG
jgi:hypothetical protein